MLDQSSLSSPVGSSSTSRHTSLTRALPGRRPELGRGPQLLPCLVSGPRPGTGALRVLPGSAATVPAESPQGTWGVMRPEVVTQLDWKSLQP